MEDLTPAPRPQLTPSRNPAPPPPSHGPAAPPASQTPGLPTPRQTPGPSQADPPPRARRPAPRIREATDADWPAIWPFFRAIVAARESYAYDPAWSEEEARAVWMLRPPGVVFVAVDADGTVLGSATGGPNRAGPGAHVATGSFMVAPEHAGRGVGRALGEHVLAWSRGRGFTAIQFNAVVETNRAAVALWHALGFTTIGTVPGAFRHPVHGDVGLHVMHRTL